MVKHTHRSRRSFFKKTGALGISVGVGGLSGCANLNDGNSSGSNKKTLRLGIPPLGVNMLALNRIREQTNILHEELKKVGYDIKTTVTWDEITLFASGKVDLVPSLSDIEGTRLAMEREIPIAFHGLALTNYEGLYVKKGSPFDPDNTGSVKATIDKMVKEQGVWGNAGWNQGSVVPGQIVMKDQFGYNYSAEKSDFKVQTADWPTLPALLADGKLDMCTNGPPLGSAIQLAQDPVPIKDILWYQPGLEKAGLEPYTANLGNFGATKEFSDSHQSAIKAFMRAWKQGAEWASNPDNFDQILSKKENVNALGGNNKEEARIILEFCQQPPKHCMSKPGNSEPVMATDIEIDQQFVKTEKKALKRAEELGALPSGWEEYVEFRPIKL